VVDQEVLETDADAFDCTTCPLAAQQAALYRENVDAWHIFHTVGRRVVVQLGMGPEVFRQCVKDREPDEIRGPPRSTEPDSRRAGSTKGGAGLNGA
jgi:hypothetical protein